MSRLFSIKFSDEDLAMLEELKVIYRFNTRSQLIKHLILWHYTFWQSMAEPVVRCKDCVLHTKCLTEDTFNFAGIENPFCCVGKKEMEKNNETD